MWESMGRFVTADINKKIIVVQSRKKNKRKRKRTNYKHEAKVKVDDGLVKKTRKWSKKTWEKNRWRRARVSLEEAQFDTLGRYPICPKRYTCIGNSVC